MKNLITRLVKISQDVLRFYTRGIALVATLGMLFNVAALLLDSNISWVLMLIGNSLFLFLLGYVGSQVNTVTALTQSLSVQASKLEQKTHIQFSKLRDKQVKVLKLAQRGVKSGKTIRKISIATQAGSNQAIEASARAEKLGNQAIEASTRAAAVSASAKKTGHQAIEISIRAKEIGQHANKSLTDLSKKVREIGKVSNQSAKSADISLHQLACLDARYSLYLSAVLPHFTEHEHSLSALPHENGLTFHQILSLLQPYSNLGVVREAEINSLAHSSEIVLVHQMGKVGSSTIYDSLSQLDASLPVFHTHILGKDIVRLILTKKLIGIRKERLARNHLISLAVNHEINQNFKHKQWKIVTLTRDPIARNISAFFQNLDLNLFFPNFEKSGHFTQEEIDFALFSFLEKAIHDIPLTWFDKQIKQIFDIDVYQTQFDPDKGYAIVEQNNVSLLVIRLESLNQSYRSAFNEFLSISNFELQPQNVAADKTYDKIYREFQKRLRLPDSYIQRMYNSRYAKHFYSAEELERFTAKWSSAE